MAYCIRDFKIHLARYEADVNSSGLNPMTVKSKEEKQCSSA